MQLCQQAESLLLPKFMQMTYGRICHAKKSENFSFRLEKPSEFQSNPRQVYFLHSTDWLPIETGYVRKQTIFNLDPIDCVCIILAWSTYVDGDGICEETSKCLFLVREFQLMNKLFKYQVKEHQSLFTRKLSITELNDMTNALTYVDDLEQNSNND